MALLRDMTVENYLEVLASDAPAPGGGSAAALAGAQGAGLAAMVTALSIGKKKYLEHTDYLTDLQTQLLALARELLADVDRDTQAFDGVSAAMKLPKETDGEKAARQQAIQAALLEATHSPLTVCRRAQEALVLLEGMAGRFNTNAASDLGTGAAMLRAAAQGAWLNILINLSGLKNEATVRALLAEGEAVYRDALARADAVFASIEQLCMPEAGRA